MPTWTYNGAEVFTPAPEEPDLATQAELDARVGVDDDGDPFIDD